MSTNLHEHLHAARAIAKGEYESRCLDTRQADTDVQMAEEHLNEAHKRLSEARANEARIEESLEMIENALGKLGELT